jgi:hypothetical protein
MSLPAGFVQIDLFDAMASEPEEKPKKKKQKGVIYRCPKCGKSVGVSIPVIVIFCDCGRRMEREDTK